MLAHERFTERIASAQHAVPYCQVCGSATRIVERNGAILLVCGTRDPLPRGVRRIVNDYLGHYEERLVEPNEDAPVTGTGRAPRRAVHRSVPGVVAFRVEPDLEASVAGPAPSRRPAARPGRSA
jgi:hypothetical protein